MTGSRMEAVLGGPARQPESPLTQREMDLARSIQDITEEVMLKMARHAHKQTGMRDLCMAGGVALNCVGNGRILREGPFEQVWVQPAAGDAGGALGVALSIWHKHLNKPRHSAESAGTWERPAAASAAVRTMPKYADGMSGSFLGPRFTEKEISDCIAEEKLVARRIEPAQVADEVAALARIGECGRPAAGPDGVWTARVRRPFDHRRRPLDQDAVGAEPEDQVP